MATPIKKFTLTFLVSKSSFAKDEPQRINIDNSKMARSREEVSSPAVIFEEFRLVSVLLNTVGEKSGKIIIDDMKTSITAKKEIPQNKTTVISDYDECLWAPGVYYVEVKIDKETWYATFQVMPKNMNEFQIARMKESLNDIIPNLAMNVHKKINYNRTEMETYIEYFYFWKKNFNDFSWAISQIIKRNSLLHLSPACIKKERQTELFWISQVLESNQKNFKAMQRFFAKKITEKRSKIENDFSRVKKSEILNEGNFTKVKQVSERIKRDTSSVFFIKANLKEADKWLACIVLLKRQINNLVRFEMKSRVMVPVSKSREALIVNKINNGAFLIQNGTLCDYGYKATSVLYEYFAFINTIKAYETLGYQWVAGWIKDYTSDNLEENDYVILKSGEKIVRLSYNKSVNKESNSKSGLYHEDEFLKPDVIVEGYSEDSSLKYLFIVEAKYRKLHYIYSKDGTKKNRAEYQFNSYSKIKHKSGVHGQNIKEVEQVIVVYPEEREEYTKIQVKTFENKTITYHQLSPAHDGTTGFQEFTETIKEYIC